MRFSRRTNTSPSSWGKQRCLDFLKHRPSSFQLNEYDAVQLRSEACHHQSIRVSGKLNSTDDYFPSSSSSSPKSSSPSSSSSSSSLHRRSRHRMAPDSAPEIQHIRRLQAILTCNFFEIVIEVIVEVVFVKIFKPLVCSLTLDSSTDLISGSAGVGKSRTRGRIVARVPKRSSCCILVRGQMGHYSESGQGEPWR